MLEAEGALEDELGEPPEVGADAEPLLAFYLERLRPFTPGDEPVDPERAIGLFDELYGPIDRSLLLDAMARLDNAYLSHRAAKLERELRTRKAG